MEIPSPEPGYSPNGSARAARPGTWDPNRLLQTILEPSRAGKFILSRGNDNRQRQIQPGNGWIHFQTNVWKPPMVILKIRFPLNGPFSIWLEGFSPHPAMTGGGKFRYHQILRAGLAISTVNHGEDSPWFRNIFLRTAISRKPPWNCQTKSPSLYFC